MIVMLWSQLRRLLSVMLMAFALASAMPAAHAVEPDEVLADPQLELRARDLSAVLRCLVCQISRSTTATRPWPAIYGCSFANA